MPRGAGTPLLDRKRRTTMKINKACELFLDYCRTAKNLSAHTHRAYQIDLADFLAYAGPHKDLAEIDKLTIRAFLGHLMEERGLKPATAKRRLACLKVMFGWLEDEELIDQNPMYRLKARVTLPKELPQALSREEMRRLFVYWRTRLDLPPSAPLRQRHFEVLKRHPDFTAFTGYLGLELLFATGVRVSELVAITLEDVDVANGVIVIHGKGNRERRVFLTDDALKYLIAVYAERPERLGTGATPLLVNTRGVPASAQFIRKLLHEAGRGAGLSRPVTPHMVRHTTATLLLEEGVDIRFVQALLGHHSIATTERYTQVSDRQLQELLETKHPRRRI